MPVKKTKRERLMDRANRLLWKIPPEEYKNITVPIVAKKLGVTPGSLAMACKREYGVTFESLVSHAKVRAGMIMMEINPDIQIKTIVHTIGFSSASHFARSFRRHFNKTPGEFKKGIPAMLERRRKMYEEFKERERKEQEQNN